MAVKKRFPEKTAFVACNGGCRKNAEDPCLYGCISCELCVNACRFGAIALNEYGVVEVDEEKCIGCGACVRACPREIIRLHEKANEIAVKCSNENKGPDARKKCEVSCIGCGICERTCTAGAIHVINNVAVIDETYCLSCGMCAVKCPRGVIRDLRGVLTKAR